MDKTDPTTRKTVTAIRATEHAPEARPLPDAAREKLSTLVTEVHGVAMVLRTEMVVAEEEEDINTAVSMWLDRIAADLEALEGRRYPIAATEAPSAQVPATTPGLEEPRIKYDSVMLALALMRVATDPVLSNPKYARDLPMQSWRTLDELARATREGHDVAAWIADGRVFPQMERQAVLRLREKAEASARSPLDPMRRAGRAYLDAGHPVGPFLELLEDLRDAAEARKDVDPDDEDLAR